MTGLPIRKRSVTIAGHATSVSLEPEFWAELRAIAGARGVSLNALVGEVDAVRGARNLSSALRVHVLEALRRSAARR
ncbi:MAG: ribbon-helix-helix domain-containing protein [Alphaproteobacteria bacterium]|nr:ribbon-helix-helix domain-containing protein [Alphaproteobacteria bacterium]MBM3627452.1 ribbon-helix-helix domain-containing protein [Alphaproteobacteria bacterium]